MKHGQQEVAYFGKEEFALLLVFSVGQNTLFFCPLNPFKEMSLLAHHMSGVDTANLTSFQKIEGTQEVQNLLVSCFYKWQMLLVAFQSPDQD